MIDEAQLEFFLVYFEEYIKAIIKDANSDAVEDSVALTEIRAAFIENLRKGLFK